MATVREHPFPLSYCKLRTQTACPPAGLSPRPPRALSMSALVLSVPRKVMTEKDKKCLHWTIWSWCPWRSSSHNASSTRGRRRQMTFNIPFLYPLFQAPTTPSLNQSLKVSSGIVWETGPFSFLIIFCFFNTYNSMKRSPRIVGRQTLCWNLWLPYFSATL